MRRRSDVTFHTLNTSHLLLDRNKHRHRTDYIYYRKQGESQRQKFLEIEIA